MQQKELLELKINACKVRRSILTGTFSAKCGHPGGSLSCADALTYLYFKEMNIDPAQPEWEDRDRFVLSKGHCAPGLYGVLARRGYFPEEEITTLRKTGSRLQGHPCRNVAPGVDMSTGSLGQGVSVATGMALGAKLQGKAWKTYSILGDGEISEGQVWEAAMFASAKGLTNMTIIVDNNNLQIDGTIEEVNSPYPIDEKFAAFGWNVINVADGNDMAQLDEAFQKAHACTDKPNAIIMKTLKGKGVSYMENKAAWHGKAPNQEEYDQGMAELDAELARLEAEYAAL